MARLVFKDDGGEQRSVELRHGLNRIGRSSYTDLFIDHATVSSVHCEVIVDGDAILVRDLGSTNGTFVNGKPIRFSPINIGERLMVGSVEIAVEETPIVVTIPKWQEPTSVPPMLKTATGKSVCINHDTREAMWRCTRCKHLLCTPCIHRIKRRGGKVLYLCPECSGTCEILPEFAPKKKVGWFGTLKEKMKTTLRIPGRKRRAPLE